MFKYNQVDKHLQNWAIQRIINKELRFGQLLCYEEAFAYEKTKVSNLIFFKDYFLIACRYQNYLEQFQILIQITLKLMQMDPKKQI
jgi:hypothetical protein